MWRVKVTSAVMRNRQDKQVWNRGGAGLKKFLVILWNYFREEMETENLGGKWCRRCMGNQGGGNANRSCSKGPERQHQPHIHWPILFWHQPRRIVDYFYLTYPMIGMATTLRLINECMDTKGKQHVSKGELIKWLGLRVAICMASNQEGGLLLFIGKIHLKKELFLVQLNMALGFVYHAIVFRILLVPCICQLSPELQKVR